MHQKTQNHFFKFSTHLSVRKSGENYRQIYGKSKASLWRNLSTCTPPKFFGTILCLQLQFTIDIFFRTAVLRKLFDIRFSYKHCNFARVCLLVKMASETVTRSIKVMLHGAIRNDGFQHNTALQCWNDVLTIRNNVRQCCNAVLR